MNDDQARQDRRETERRERTQGVACPGCGCRHMPVRYVKHKGARTIRCRICRNCGRRVRTTERADPVVD